MCAKSYVTIMKIALLLLTLCLFVGSVYCGQKNVTAIKVKPCFGSEAAVQLSPASDKGEVESLSFCLRFKMISWSYSIFLVKSENFGLDLTPFDRQYLGYFQYYNSEKEVFLGLGPKKLLSFSTSSWNSICLVYSAMTESLTFFLNGETLNVKLLSISSQLGNFSMLELELASCNECTALFTDFNAWSRALPLDEALTFSLGSDSNIAFKASPDLFNWKKQNMVRLNISCAEWHNVEVEKVFMNSAIFKNPEVVSITNQNFGDAMKTCQSLNGILFDPKNSSYFRRLESITLEKLLETCDSQFWIPNQLLDTKSKVKFLDTLNFEQSGKKTFSREDSCIYYEYLKGKYMYIECTSILCTLCQIEQDRLAFQTQSDCQDSWRDVNSQFIIEQQNPSELWLISPGSVIKRNDYKWTLSVLLENDTEMIVESTTDDIFGLSQWNSGFCGVKSSTTIKLTNVSLLPSYKI